MSQRSRVPLHHVLRVGNIKWRAWHISKTGAEVLRDALRKSSVDAFEAILNKTEEVIMIDRQPSFTLL
ncbi:MAG: hypothetical protein R8G34_13765 [Paracoccaceae bacterium]|nr:hypothetical protein [Paracoccaceae bacterium]